MREEKPMTNLEKIEEMMKNDPTLQEKLAAETKRLTDSGEKDIRKISGEAVKATFGVDFTEEELDQVTQAAEKAARKLDLDELDNVAGGITISFTCSFLGHDWELTAAKQTGSFRNGPDSQYEEYTCRRCGQKYYNKIKTKENYTVMDDVKNRLGLNVIDEDTYRDVK